MPSPYYFFSYAHRDKDRMRALVDALREHDVAVWVDEDGLKGGARWLHELEKKIRGCQAMIVLMSAAARESEWVERETLLALELRKLVFVARYDHIPLPLHLINRQFIPFEDEFETAVAQMLAALQLPEDEDTTALPLRPTEDTFFAYLAQMPQGEKLSLVARELYHEASRVAHDVVFSGKHTPSFQARLKVADQDITLFAVTAYLRNPAVVFNLDSLAKAPAYHDEKAQSALLSRIEEVLPEVTFSSGRRRPALPLRDVLQSAETLEALLALISDIHQAVLR
jgi:hypothetical protein